MLIFSSILMGVLGVFLYSLLKLVARLQKDKKNNKYNPFSVQHFIRDNLVPWIIANLITQTLIIALFVDPLAVEYFQMVFTGFEIRHSPAGMFGLGLFISFISKLIT